LFVGWHSSRRLRRAGSRRRLVILPAAVTQPFHGLRNELSADFFAVKADTMPQSPDDFFRCRALRQCGAE
jgi:hypothetical protein